MEWMTEVWSVANTPSSYIWGDGGWILAILFLVWFYRYDAIQENTVNAIYDDREIDPNNLPAVYRNQSDNIRDLQLVSIKNYLLGIFILIAAGLYKIW